MGYRNLAFAALIGIVLITMSCNPNTLTETPTEEKKQEPIAKNVPTDKDKVPLKKTPTKSTSKSKTPPANKDGIVTLHVPGMTKKLKLT